jgi:hypothetical protein
LGCWCEPSKDAQGENERKDIADARKIGLLQGWDSTKKGANGVGVYAQMNWWRSWISFDPTGVFGLCLVVIVVVSKKRAHEWMDAQSISEIIGRQLRSDRMRTESKKKKRR